MIDILGQIFYSAKCVLTKYGAYQTARLMMSCRRSAYGSVCADSVANIMIYLLKITGVDDFDI